MSSFHSHPHQGARAPVAFLWLAVVATSAAAQPALRATPSAPTSADPPLKADPLDPQAAVPALVQASSLARFRAQAGAPTGSWRDAAPPGDDDAGRRPVSLEQPHPPPHRQSERAAHGKARLRIGNPTLTNHPVHPHGHEFPVTGTDGGPTPKSTLQDEFTGSLPDPARFASAGGGSMPPARTPTVPTEVTVRKLAGGHTGH